MDAGLAAAMQRLVEASLGVVPGECVLVIHDADHDDVAEAVHDAGDSIGSGSWASG